MNGGSTLCKSTIPNLWKKSEPNGDRIENCVVIEYDFIDVDCNYKACGACEIDNTIVFATPCLCSLFPRILPSLQQGWLNLV